MSNALANLSAQQLRKAATIRDRIDALQKELNGILGSADGAAAPRAARPKTAAPEAPKRRFSKATRAKMAARAKERWAKARASGKKSL